MKTENQNIVSASHQLVYVISFSRSNYFKFMFHGHVFMMWPICFYSLKCSMKRCSLAVSNEFTEAVRILPKVLSPFHLYHCNVSLSTHDQQQLCSIEDYP